MSDSRLVTYSGERLGPWMYDEAEAALKPQLLVAHESLQRRNGPGREMLGWLDLPGKRGEEYRHLRTTALRLRSEVDVLVVIGIGGSYLGTKALLDALGPRLRGRSGATTGRDTTAGTAVDSGTAVDAGPTAGSGPAVGEEGAAPVGGGPRPGPDIVFAGHHLEASYYAELLSSLEGREVAVNVISKSGTTTEPAIAFRLLRDWMVREYGPQKAASRIIATTDASKGALRQMATEKGWESFVVPDDVGGRFSVLSPVGLLPLATAGVDVEAVMDGAQAEFARCALASDVAANPAAGSLFAAVPAMAYAAARYQAYLSGALVEVLASFHPSMHYVGEWWKQLFGESEGKQWRGLFPASVDYTTDLHSLGQYLQEGRRILIETFLEVGVPEPGPDVPQAAEDLDGLGYLEGQSLASINQRALAAVADAHREGGVPSGVIGLPAVDEYSLGSLIFFFEYAVALGGRLLGVNPFDQPGVEAYKKNLFRVLGKPGAQV